MKKLIILVAFSAIPLFASVMFTESKITDFHGTYVEPIGKGKAKEFLGIKNFFQGVDVGLEKVGPQSLKVNYAGEEVVVNDLPESIFDMKELDWEGFNIDLSRQNFSLSLTTLRGESTDSLTQLRNLDLNCLITNRNRSQEYVTLIKGCTKQGSLELDFYSDTNPRKDNFLSVFFYRSLNYPLSSDTKLSNVSFSINSHNFKLSLRYSGSISANVKGSGKIWYLDESGELKIKLEKAKAGIISIKNQIFKELESSNDPKMRVERPYIYYSISN